MTATAPAQHRSWFALPPQPPSRRRSVVFRGDLRSTMGYAYETRAIASLLPKEYEVFGVDLHYNPRDNYELFPGELLLDKDVQKLCNISDRQVFVISNNSPEGYVYFPGAINIGIFSWETDAIAYDMDWPEMISAMDFNWAKTNYQRELLRRCGYPGSVPIVAWPFDFDTVSPPRPELLAGVKLNYVDRLGSGPAQPLPAARLVGLGDPLLLSVSSMAPRKGVPILLSEWRDHVEGGGEGVLMLKLRPIHNHRLEGGGAPDMTELLAEAGFRTGDRVRIAYTFEDLEPHQLTELYRLSDVYITASYGEGFGGPVVEALILGRPVIAPRHSSLADLLAPDYPLQVESRRRCVGLAGNSPIYPHASSWGLPVRGGLMRAIRTFVQMSHGRRDEVMMQARSHAQAFCSRPVVAAALQRFFDGLETR